MTTSTPAPARPRARQRPRGPLVLAAGGLLLAVLLTAVDAPTWLRTSLCLPLLVGIGGAAITALVLPHRDRLDGLTRAALVLLFGLVLLVVAALMVALVFRDGLGAGRLVVVTAALALVALVGLAARQRHDVVPVPRSAPRAPAASPSARASVAAGLLIVVAALVLGRTLLSSGGAVPTFAFTGGAGTESGPTAVAPGGVVALDWVARNTEPLPAGRSVQAVMDGRPVDVVSDVTPFSDGQYAGRTVLVAPAMPGLHRVVLSLPLPEQRLELVTYVDVRPA